MIDNILQIQQSRNFGIKSFAYFCNENSDHTICNFMAFRKYICLFLLSLICGNYSAAQDALAFEDPGVNLFISLSDEERIEKLITMTDSLLTSEPDLCLTYAKESLKLAEKLENDESRLTVLIQLAKIYKNETKLVSAINYVERAKALSLKLDNERKYVETLLINGNIYNLLGDFEKCAEQNFEALKVSNRIKYKTGIANSLNNMASVYAKQKNFDKAIEYHTQSLMIARQDNDLVGISRNLNNLATIYITQGEFDKAEPMTKGGC